MKRNQIYVSKRDNGDERPVQTSAVWAPRVLALQGESLLCDADQNRLTGAGSGLSSLLSNFVDLAEAQPGNVLRFARKWGSLGAPRKPAHGQHFLQPVRSWIDLAVRFRALLTIGSSLNFEEPGSASNWADLGIHQAPQHLKEARFVFMSQMRRLIDDSGLRPRFFWNDKTTQWQIDLDAYSASNLMAVLTLQLMIAVADKDGYAICSNCHRSYIPKRRPAANRRNYCSVEICKKAAWRDSKRALRSTKEETADV